uniref:Putative pirin protein n=1 Tax=mine drainage metagenome TaxID=410659 RepID=E6QVC6_9ZZZZ
MLEMRRSKDRGTADFGWLYSRHTFSFGNYFDPKQVGYSDLLVINDDIVQPGQGFGTHPHRDMEIFSYVLEGALAHKDSMGTGSVIRSGDVQMMSAGTGIQHSEFNHSQSERVHFLQIWITPDRKGVNPRYQQVHFPESEKRGRLRLIISPDAENDSLSVYQDVRVYAGCFHGEECASLTLSTGRFAYVHVARGAVTINGIRFESGDGARLRDETAIDIQGGVDAEVLVFVLRPVEVPSV